MKTTLLPFAGCILSMLTCITTHAQYFTQTHVHYSTQNDYPKNEISISEGVITLEELNGWNGKGGASGFVSLPSAISGAVFATYRHFLTRRFAIGGTIGFDNESGDLSYGNPEHNATGLEGTSGHYIVHTYTFAVEALFAYIRTPRFMFYGYTGLGVTDYRDNYNFYGFYGAPVTFPTNPYNYHTAYFNMQVTPIGIRFGGNIAGFVEFGFGYTGLFSGGLSFRF